MEKEEHALLLRYLKESDTDKNNLSLYDMRTLEQLSCIATKMIAIQNEAYQLLRDNKISISRISELTGIARSSIYNNSTIYKFISYLISQNIKIGNSEYTDKLKELQEKVQTFYKTDNAICRTEYENKRLLEENTRLKGLVAKQDKLLHQNGIPRPTEFTNKKKEISAEEFRLQKQEMNQKS